MGIAPFTRPWGESFLRGNALLTVTVFGISAGFLLFGYDQGIANALTQNPEWQTRFASIAGDTTRLGAVLGTFVLGAMSGALFNFWLGNRISRRSILYLAVMGTIVFGALQAGSVNTAMFVVTRFLNGFAVGMHTALAGSYMAELAKPEVRGRLITFEWVIGSTGLMSSFWVTYGFRKSTEQSGWRVPLAIQAMISVLCLIALFFSPESPRWLCEKGRYEEAHAVLARLYGEQYAIDAIADIKEAIVLEREAAAQHKGLMACFLGNSQCFRYRTMLSITVNMFQQLTGINMATYYAGAIFIEAIGLGVDRGLLALGGLGICGSVFTLIGCLFMVDQLGRVNTMIIGAFFCGVGQVLLAAGIANIEGSGAYVAATGLYLFLASFSACWLAPGWTYGAEIAPLAIRTRAAGLGAATQYIFNFFVVQVTPVGIANIGYRFHIPWAILNFAMIPALWFFFPEVSMLSLEEVDQLFIDGKVTVRHNPRSSVGHIQHGPSTVPVFGEKEDNEQLENKGRV